MLDTATVPSSVTAGSTQSLRPMQAKMARTLLANIVFERFTLHDQAGTTSRLSRAHTLGAPASLSAWIICMYLLGKRSVNC